MAEDTAAENAESAGGGRAAEGAESGQVKRRLSLTEFSPQEKRALSVMTVIALGFGAYFLRGYLELIALAAVLAYLFLPLRRRFRRRFGSGASTGLTVLSAIGIVVIPLAGILTMAGVQIKQMIDSVSDWVGRTDMTRLGEQVLAWVNDLLDRVPYVDAQLTPENIQDGISTLAASAGTFALNFARGSVGGIATAITMAIIFLYVFIALLGDGQKVVSLAKDLNPLSDEVSNLYLSKIGAMVSATVGGQFVIAFAQGLAGAISIYLGGLREGFFMFVIFLTVMSIIPLGSGVVAIPVGIGMALTGNIAGGVFVVVFHLLVTTNIDNVLRPMLVPRTAYLHPALMLVAVFAGLQMFGFLGIVFGPVLMIIIVTTINLYRAVHKGVDLADDFTGDKGVVTQKKSIWTRLRERFGSKAPARS